MSEVDNAMLQRMFHIVCDEHKSFCYLDFLDLMKPTTYRNKICKLKKDGIVELDYISGVAFHTLKGYRSGKPVTPNHIGVSSSNSDSLPLSITVGHNDPVYQMIKNLPMDRQAIHDIRAKFQVPNIYDAFSNVALALPTTTTTTPNTTTPRAFQFQFPKDDVNCDIRLPYWNVNNAIVQVRIHKTDTVSVIVACSRNPFSFDYNGIIRFFTTLADTHGLLVGLTFSNQIQSGLTVSTTAAASLVIPRYQSWLVTQWHFGRDSLTTYKGEKYEITVEGAQHIFTRLYTKDYGKFKKIRLERVESPRKPVPDAIQDKLDSDYSDSDGGPHNG